MIKPKYKRGKQLSVKVRKEEKEWVTRFTLSRIIKDESVIAVPMRDIFAEYSAFLVSQGLETRLNIDGFGRFFPKFFKREYLRVGKASCVCLVGARLI